jgi:hypothetical protein
LTSLAGLLSLLLSVEAPAEEAPQTEGGATPKLKGEVSMYDDTDSVNVFTSALSGSLENPVGGWSADGSYLVDVVSAASVDIVSTASSRWTEVRHAGTLGANYKPGSVGVGASGAVSTEPDYLSLAGGTRLSLDLADRMALATLGYSFLHDTAGRKGTPFSVYSLELARHTLSAGLELVVDRSTLLSFNGDALLESGDQSKPYRFLPMFSPQTAPTIQPGASLALVNNARLPGRMAEHDPDRRYRFALSARLARRFRESTLVLSQRLYADDWGLKATTTDLRYVLDASQKLEIWWHFRGYVQNSVDFWQRAYSAVVSANSIQVPLYRTGDRELSALSTGTLGIGGRWKLASPESAVQWRVGLQSDIMLTFFRDTLFVRDRKAVINTLDLQAEF